MRRSFRKGENIWLSTKNSVIFDFQVKDSPWVWLFFIVANVVFSTLHNAGMCYFRLLFDWSLLMISNNFRSKNFLAFCSAVTPSHIWELASSGSTRTPSHLGIQTHTSEVCCFFYCRFVFTSGRFLWRGVFHLDRNEGNLYFLLFSFLLFFVRLSRKYTNQRKCVLVRHSRQTKVHSCWSLLLLGQAHVLSPLTFLLVEKLRIALNELNGWVLGSRNWSLDVDKNRHEI